MTCFIPFWGQCLYIHQIYIICTTFKYSQIVQCTHSKNLDTMYKTQYIRDTFSSWLKCCWAVQNTYRKASSSITNIKHLFTYWQLLMLHIGIWWGSTLHLHRQKIFQLNAYWSPARPTRKKSYFCVKNKFGFQKTRKFTGTKTERRNTSSHRRKWNKCVWWKMKTIIWLVWGKGGRVGVTTLDLGGLSAMPRMVPLGRQERVVGGDK